MSIMDSLRSIYLLLIIAFFGYTYADLPADIKKCHAGDVACITKTINYILTKYPDGNKDFGLNSLYSIPLKDIVVSKANPNSAIQLNFKLNTLNVMGFENATITRVVGFEEDPLKSKYEVYLEIPALKMSGEYETSGKILLLPINGKGHSEMLLKDVRIGIKIKAHLETVNGINYGKINKVKSTLDIGRLHVQLENLFGQKELSDTMNDMINQNWQDVWSEVQVGVNAALAKIVNQLISDVLKELPHDDFYLEN